jgi:putative tryptophan/tyrosine transport system substrate-binding protein
MRRRELLASFLAGAVGATGHSVRAQAPRRARIGYLSGTIPAQGFAADILKQGLHELGWHEGESLAFDERYAQGDVTMLPRLAAELVALRPDVLVASGSSESKALQAATRDIPIVFLQGADPVSMGLVASIARPGGNITGLSAGPQLLFGKRLELLAELLGRPPRRLAWLGNPTNALAELTWTHAEKTSAAFGAEIRRVDVAKPGDLDRAFDGLAGLDAVLVQFDFLLVSHRERIAELAATRRLPAIYENRFQVLKGGLMSYGPDLRDNFRRGAAYVDRILKGARPADLPVDQASRFELVLNLGAARALGLAIPPTLLARADEVIE